MRCFRCQETAIKTTVVCLEHLAESDLEAYAIAYAVASILYYEHDEHFFEDARFDGLCHRLKEDRAAAKVEWLEDEMLTAGSGYDTSRFPAIARELAEDWLLDKDPMFQ